MKPPTTSASKKSQMDVPKKPVITPHTTTTAPSPHISPPSSKHSIQPSSSSSIPANTSSNVFNVPVPAIPSKSTPKTPPTMQQKPQVTAAPTSPKPVPKTPRNPTCSTQAPKPPDSKLNSDLSATALSAIERAKVIVARKNEPKKGG